jgi:hypothetical protein
MEQAGPFLLAVPAAGQVKSEVAAAVARSARSDIDEVPAQGGAPGAGRAGCRRGLALAEQQVVRLPLDPLAGLEAQRSGARAPPAIWGSPPLSLAWM